MFTAYWHAPYREVSTVSAPSPPRDKHTNDRPLVGSAALARSNYITLSSGLLRQRLSARALRWFPTTVVRVLSGRAFVVTCCFTRAPCPFSAFLLLVARSWPACDAMLFPLTRPARRLLADPTVYPRPCRTPSSPSRLSSVLPVGAARAARLVPLLERGARPSWR